MQSSNLRNTQRGRPREFDVEVTLERAMQVFWSKGYHATSLPDLLTATDLSRGSLYGAFGDKRGLFLRALDRYIDQGLTRLEEELASTAGALEGIRAVLDGYLARTSGAAGRRGCLIVATAMELAAHDPEIASRIRRNFRAMETKLTASLERARREREIAADADPAALANLLVCLVEGLRVVRKVSSNASEPARAIGALLDRFAS